MADDDQQTDDQQQKSQAQVLVELARNRFRFGVSTDRTPFALPVDGGPVAAPFRGGGGGLRQVLAAAYLDNTGKPPSSNALADALVALEGFALRSDPQELHLRVARTPAGEVALDLGREDGTSVVLAAGGWTLTDLPGVIWRRTDLTSPLPDPVGGGDPLDLGRLVNVTDADLPLLVAWCVAALIPDLPHPLAFLTGEQGTGKTVAARTVASLLDPSPAPVRAAPRDVDAWGITASASWVVALDNISKLSDQMSDALCRAATGDGLVRRRLYTDSGVSVLSFRRVVMLTSIDAGALRGDLAERLVVFDLERLGDRRTTEQQLDRNWSQAHPRLLGSLLDLACDVLRLLPDVHLDGLPRMADFARVVAAVDQVLGTNALDHYLGQSKRLASDVVEADPVAAGIVELLDDVKEWSGSSTDLRNALKERLGDPDRLPRWFPKDARRLSGDLRRVSPALRDIGFVIDQLSDGKRTWVLGVQGKKERRAPSPPSAASTPAPDGADADDGTSRAFSPPTPLCTRCGEHPDARVAAPDLAGLCAMCVDKATS